MRGEVEGGGGGSCFKFKIPFFDYFFLQAAHRTYNNHDSFYERLIFGRGGGWSGYVDSSNFKILTFMHLFVKMPLEK